MFSWAAISQTDSITINESAKKVLIVHSYHKGYKWTDDIILGIEAGLPPNTAIYTEYLDSKRIPPEDDYFKLLLQLFKYKTDIHKYDLIMCSDNNAFDFIQDYCNLLNYHPPVVFCGLNELEEGEVAKYENVTGVNEKADFIKGFELIHKIHPLKTKLIFITDNTPSGQRLTYQLKKILADSVVPFDSVELINNIAMPDLLEKLYGLGNNTIVYYTFFIRDSLNNFFEYNKSSKMICDASPVPVYGGWDFNMGSGLLGGYLVSGYQQGFKAAELAGLILSGVPVSEVPVIMDSPNQYIFDYEIAKKFNVDLAQLEQYGQVINRPYSAFEQYKEWIYGVLGILFLLIIIVILLTINALIRRRSEKKIVQAKEILETTLNSIGDGVIATDVNGVITNMNLMAEQLTGWTEQNAISEPLENVFKILHSVNREPIKYSISKIISSRKINEIVHPTVLISENGHEFQVATKASPIIHHDNSIFGVVIVFRDVSEEYRMTRALKASEKKFRNYIQASSIAIFILNKELKLTYANPAAENLTGYSFSELIKIQLANLIDKQSLEKLLSFFKMNEKPGRIKDLEIKIGQKGGNQIFILLDLVKLNNDDHILYCRDVNELKNIQAHLAAKNQDYKVLTEELRYKIADLKALNSQLAEAKERAEESDRLKTAFLANMSHEIRTPINGILGFSALLEESDLPDPNHKKYLNIIQQSGDRILNIFNHIIDISKIEAGQTELNYEMFEVFSVCISLKDFFTPGAAKKGLSLVLAETSTGETFINSDKTKVEQILANLIKNAIKFTKKGRVEFGYQLDNGLIQFYVKDTGIGIDPKLHDTVFKRFVQIGAINGTFYDGAGIGLSISKAYVNLLGGSIWLESELGKGATFYFSLPLNLDY